MTAQNDNTHKYNLPSYINTPHFLYQDNRLEKSATMVAAFFYSLFTSGKSIKASREYLSALACVGKSQYFVILNQLESCGYIRRTGNTKRRKMEWIYIPGAEIIIDESGTSPGGRTQLVREAGLNLSGRPDTDTKEDTREVNKLTNCESSSFIFNKVLDQQMLEQKLPKDSRTDEEFLKNVAIHIENFSDASLSVEVRQRGALKLLKNQKMNNEVFYASGTAPKEPTEIKPKSQNKEQKPYTDEEFNKIQDYKHAKKMENRGYDINIYMKKELRDEAEMLLKRISSEVKSCSQNKTVRRGCLTSVSNLVSHLN